MRSKNLVALAAVTAVTLVAGCGLTTATVPVALRTAPINVDIDAQRAALEHTLCDDVQAGACGVLRNLDASDDGIINAAPAMPAVMPLTILNGREHVDVAEWIEQQRAVHDVVPALTIPITIDGATVKSALARAQLTDASLVFDDDTLALDLPALTINAGERFVGVIAAHAGGSGEAAQVSLADGGSDALLAAVARSESVTISAAGAALGLLAGPGGDTITRPGGHASLSLAISLDVDVDLEPQL